MPATTRGPAAPRADARPAARCPRCGLAVRRPVEAGPARCPRCGEALGGRDAAEPEGFTPLLLLTCVAAVLFLGGLLLSVAVGGAAAVVISGGIGACLLAVWLGRHVRVAAPEPSLARVAAAPAAPPAKPTVEPTALAPSPYAAEPAVTAEDRAPAVTGPAAPPAGPGRSTGEIFLPEVPRRGRRPEPALALPAGSAFGRRDDPLVEIVPVGPKAPPAPRVTAPDEPSFWSTLDSLVRGRGESRTAEPTFYGPGTELKLDRAVLRSPLVYAVNGTAASMPDASLVELGLRAARPGSRPDGHLPYWPSYRGCTPSQRSHYLDWLAGGRRDPHVEVGYVFIYFYGLERRVVVDGADHDAVARELIRLLGIYSGSNSFRRYASALLWLAIVYAADGALSDEFVASAVAATPHWSEENLAACLAWHCKRDRPLPPGVARLVAEHDPRSPRSVVVKRHPEMFANLFETRYRERFPEGLALRPYKQSRRLDYVPASATLSRMALDGSAAGRGTGMPNVPPGAAQFKPLLEIWESTVEDLRAYDRAHRSSDGGRMTAAMYEALPPDLRAGDHPEFDDWYRVAAAHVTGDGWTLVPVSALAAIKGFEARGRLTKGQCAQLLATADAVGLAVEPDARITGRNYAWDERVSVFPADEGGREDPAAYNAAAVLLRLGLTVAAADGTVHEEELTRVTAHLEDQLDLSPREAARLEHLRKLLLTADPAELQVGTQLQKRLSKAQLRSVGGFLVGVAAADGQVTDDELRALRKAYRGLGLDPAELDELIVEDEAAAGPAGDTAAAGHVVHLDRGKIDAIMRETAKVSALLRDVLADEEASTTEPVVAAAPSPSTPEPPAVRAVPPVSTDSEPASDRAARATIGDGREADGASFDGLDARYRPFLEAALGRERWGRAEIEALARGNGLMLGGAVEAVNEWSLDALGDWLLDEEGDGVAVRTDLLGPN